MPFPPCFVFALPVSNKKALPIILSIEQSVIIYRKGF